MIVSATPTPDIQTTKITFWDMHYANQTTDDNHNSHRYHKGVTMWDSFGGWIQIVSEEFSRNAIFEALVSGSYYSSSGPEIYQYGVKDNKLFIDCSACKEVIFKTYPRRGYVVKEDTQTHVMLSMNVVVEKNMYELSVWMNMEEKHGRIYLK